MPSAKRRVVVFPSACLSGGMKGAARYAPCWAERWNPRDERQSSSPQKLLTVFYRLRSLTRATAVRANARGSTSRELQFQLATDCAD